MNRVVVIGLGGIGGALVPHLARYLRYTSCDATLVLIDGDVFEERNNERQVFDEIGGKAEVVSRRIKSEIQGLHVEFVNEYIDNDTVGMHLQNGDYVFLCVDNHATRKVVSDFCEELDDVTLISGGNELTDGNVQIFVRRDGENRTLPIANDFHPEIQYTRDRNPADVGCEQQVEGEPQLLFMNVAIASAMLSAYYAVLQGKLDKDEVYVDIITGNCRAVKRR